MEIVDIWKDYNSSRSQIDRNSLIASYWPLVGEIAREVNRRIRNTVSVDELQSFGAVGLIEAVERFNAEVQPSFEGYARIRIRGSIMDELRASDWVPRSIRMKEQQYNKAVDELVMELSRLPNDQEIATHLKMSPPEYRRLLIDAGIRSVQSLDVPIDTRDGSSGTLHDLIPDIPTEESQDYTEKAIELINTLPLRERIILRLFYVEGLSFPEIADLMAFGESRASQIHSSAIESLREGKSL